jgi:hypothetical protein
MIQSVEQHIDDSLVDILSVRATLSQWCTVAAAAAGVGPFFPLYVTQAKAYRRSASLHEFLSQNLEPLFINTV